MNKWRLAANRLRLDYRAEANRLGPPVRPIIDAHSHINGAEAAAVFKDVCDLYGIQRIWSQTQLGQAEGVRRVLGDRVRFVAIPTYMAEDRKHAFTHGFLEALDAWHEYGARMVKFWAAPRFLDYAAEAGIDPSTIFRFDSPWRLRVAERARELGMMLMVHVADPDTWFATKYQDVARYGSKREQYHSLERLLTETGMPCMAAHMGGWPEDLGFLSGLLDRHPRLVLDTSATKWIVRELSKHDRADLVAFLERYRGRVLFGSDIVTSDEHLHPTDLDHPAFGNQLAHAPEDAFDLYAGRYWAQRVMWETDYDGESNIADPDLALVEPDAYDELSAPRLVGRSLPPDLLDALYAGAAEATIERWRDEHL